MDWSHSPAQCVLEQFEALCRIPHPSYHTEAISDYCVAQAKQLGLAVRRDKANNVIIWKPASRGRENDPAVMVQGHLDMVPASDPGVVFDFTKDSLRLLLDGDFLTADGTTLGGDDGIAIAMGLSLLADETISHPPLICVFTTDEEVGLLGAQAMDMSDLHASYMINLDMEEEGSLIAGCAGGMRTRLSLPLARQTAEGDGIRLTLSGLIGGHSGVEIANGRTNAIRLMAEILRELLRRVPGLGLADLSGGMADNAIPAGASALLCVPADSREALRETLRAVEEEKIAPVRARESGAALAVTEEAAPGSAAPAPEAAAAMDWLLSLPDGVQKMSPDIPGLPETSLNLGMISWPADGPLVLTQSLRSSIHEEKEALADRLEQMTAAAGGQMERSGDYPGWPVRMGTPLMKLACEVWERQTGQTLQVNATHGGLECGLFATRFPDLDIIAMGPTMYDVHTPRERISVSSIERVWAFLIELLRELS